MQTSYLNSDVILLLKDISGQVKYFSVEEREKLSKRGFHYSNMLPIERIPSKECVCFYKDLLKIYSKRTAIAIAKISEKIVKERGTNFVIVSLIRAGVSIGILIKHYMEKKYNVILPHYAVSIIRGKGIDKNAIEYILSHHNPSSIQFVDGWTGKGTIYHELKNSIVNYENVSSELAVLSDPAGITKLCATHMDILIPNACLNATISGLISRTFYSKKINKKYDYHGAVYYENFKSSDLTYDFITNIERHFNCIGDCTNCDLNDKIPVNPGINEVKTISNCFELDNINLVKPGIGETIRTLLKRVPWQIIITKNAQNNADIRYIIRLAKEKKVKTSFYPLTIYRSCALIKRGYAENI